MFYQMFLYSLSYHHLLTPQIATTLNIKNLIYLQSFFIVISDHIPKDISTKTAISTQAATHLAGIDQFCLAIRPKTMAKTRNTATDKIHAIRNISTRLCSLAYLSSSSIFFKIERAKRSSAWSEASFLYASGMLILFFQFSSFKDQIISESIYHPGFFMFLH